MVAARIGVTSARAVRMRKGSGGQVVRRHQESPLTPGAAALPLPSPRQIPCQ